MEIQAANLTAGDQWTLGKSIILVTGTELTDNGLFRIRGRIIAGQGFGHVKSWTVQRTQECTVMFPEVPVVVRALTGTPADYYAEPGRIEFGD